MNRLVLAVFFAGCSSAASNAPRAVAPPESEGPYGDERSLASQLVVGLEVATDAGQSRLVAVVSHPDGTRETHDLGAYRGPIRELAPVGDMLLRVGAEDIDEVFLVGSEGSLDALRRRRGMEDELILHLDLPEGTTVTPSTPALILPAE